MLANHVTPYMSDGNHNHKMKIHTMSAFSPWQGSSGKEGSEAKNLGAGLTWQTLSTPALSRGQ
jgi:hypothetical protein